MKSKPTTSIMSVKYWFFILSHRMPLQGITFATAVAAIALMMTTLVACKPLPAKDYDIQSVDTQSAKAPPAKGVLNVPAPDTEIASKDVAPEPASRAVPVRRGPAAGPQ